MLGTVDRRRDRKRERKDDGEMKEKQCEIRR